MTAFRNFVAALVLALAVSLAPTPAAAQTEAQIREIAAWVAPVNDIQTRMQQTTGALSEVSRAVRNAASRDEIIALLRAAQPRLVAARTQLQALRREADAIAPLEVSGLDDNVIAISNAALDNTKSSLEMFESAVVDMQQLLPAAERSDQAELQRIAGRMVVFAATMLRSQVATLRLVQAQTPRTDPGHHTTGARAELTEALFVLLTLSAATDNSALTGAADRASVLVSSGRVFWQVERGALAYNTQDRDMRTAISDIEEQELAVLDAYVAAVRSASARVNPQTPIEHRFGEMRTLAQFDVQLTALAVQASDIAQAHFTR